MLSEMLAKPVATDHGFTPAKGSILKLATRPYMCATTESSLSKSQYCHSSKMEICLQEVQTLCGDVAGKYLRKSSATCFKSFTGRRSP
jgi:hypothetical protein